MQPETTAASWQPDRLVQALPEQWRGPLFLLIAGALALMAVTFREWGEMVHQWWNIDTYTHVLLVPVIIAWLVLIKAEELARLTPRPWPPGRRSSSRSGTPGPRSVP